jgi:hypothetical protein
MSLQSTDHPTQAAAMRVAADLTERALSFGAETVPLWSFYATGANRASFTLEGTPSEREMDAWRLALGTAVNVTGMNYQSSVYGRLVRCERMCAVYAGITIEIETVRPAAAEQGVTL